MNGGSTSGEEQRNEQFRSDGGGGEEPLCYPKARITAGKMTGDAVFKRAEGVGGRIKLAEHLMKDSGGNEHAAEDLREVDESSQDNRSN